MKFEAKHLFILLLLLSVVIQCTFGNFPFAFFAFPLDALIALLWIAGMVYAYKENRASRFVQMWLSPQCTYWTLGWLIAGSLVIGLFPQLSAAEAAERSGLLARLGCYHFTTSWIFVVGLFALLTHLGMITLRRGFRPGHNRWRFVLNHAGLWLALFAGVVGSAEEQTLRIPVFRDRPNNEAVSEEGGEDLPAEGAEVERFHGGALRQRHPAPLLCRDLDRREAGPAGGQPPLCGQLGRGLLPDLVRRAVGAAALLRGADRTGAAEIRHVAGRDHDAVRRLPAVSGRPEQTK